VWDKILEDVPQYSAEFDQPSDDEPATTYNEPSKEAIMVEGTNQALFESIYGTSPEKLKAGTTVNKEGLMCALNAAVVSMKALNDAGYTPEFPPVTGKDLADELARPEMKNYLAGFLLKNEAFLHIDQAAITVSFHLGRKYDFHAQVHSLRFVFD